MLTEYQQKVIDDLPEDRRVFMEKQTHAFTDWMEGNYFMSNDGYCWKCRGDVIKYQIEKGNDGSVGVTGCPYCHISYCE
jgi:hypothetical protein